MVNADTELANSGLFTPPPSPSLPFATFHGLWQANNASEEEEELLRDDLDSLTLNSTTVDTEYEQLEPSPQSTDLASFELHDRFPTAYQDDSRSNASSSSEPQPSGDSSLPHETSPKRRLRGTGQRHTRRSQLPTPTESAFRNSSHAGRSTLSHARTRSRSYRTHPYSHDHGHNYGHDSINYNSYTYPSSSSVSNEVDTSSDGHPSPLMQIAGLYPV